MRGRGEGAVRVVTAYRARERGLHAHAHGQRACACVSLRDGCEGRVERETVVVVVEVRVGGETWEC